MSHNNEIDLKKEKSIEIFISKLITDAEMISLDMRHQANIIETEVLDISNSFSDKFIGSILNIFRSSERSIKRISNYNNSECVQVCMHMCI